MVLFHNIVCNLIPISLPEYLSLFDGINPLRLTHLDELCYVSNVIIRNTGISNLNKSFFFRSHTLWNSLPYDIRSLKNPKEFNTNLEKYFWSLALNTADESGEDGLSSCDENE